MIRIEGHPPVQKTFSRLADAKAWAQEKELRLRHGEYRPTASEAKRRTLTDAIEKYRVEVLSQKAPSSQRIESTCHRFWLAELGSYALSMLSPEIISKKMAVLTGTGDRRRTKSEVATKPKSRKTIKLYRDNLELILKHAQGWGWLGNSNPMDGVTRITKANKERVRFLSNNERPVLLQACKESPNPPTQPSWRSQSRGL